MKHILVFLFLFVVLCTQEVSEIIVTGNKITKVHVIRREIQHPVNVNIDSSLAQEDRDRIENLGIYSIVEWQAVPLENGTVRLKYNVIESSRIFPALFPQYEEETGWSFLFGLIVQNFRGQNETLALGALVGGIDAYGVNFNNPWIFGDHVSISLNTGKNIIDHVFLPYEEQTSSFGINMGRYFGYERRVNVGIEFQRKNYVDDNTTVEFEYFAPQTNLTYDTRDIYTDPSKGVYINHYLQFYSFLNRDGQSTVWEQSYSGYVSPLKGKRKTTIGFNFTLNSTHGDLHRELLYRGLGGAYSIRGWKVGTREIFESGEQSYRFGFFQFISSFELRQTLIPRFSVKKKTPFGVMKTEFGLQAVLFVDTGTAGGDWNDLIEEIPMLGAGIGIRIPAA
ncbi:MAG TPA: hypothetical protein ENH49_02905, partial [Candidatus Marinimicrobia bacterium]|nr:hypothetical protein [Candidatus Neomarinimicrobiota bacterium]